MNERILPEELNPLILDWAKQLEDRTAHAPDTIVNKVVVKTDEPDVTDEIGKIYPATDDDRTHVMVLKNKSGAVDTVLIIGANVGPGIPDFGFAGESPVKDYHEVIGFSPEVGDGQFTHPVTLERTYASDHHDVGPDIFVTSHHSVGPVLHFTKILEEKGMLIADNRNKRVGKMAKIPTYLDKAGRETQARLAKIQVPRMPHPGTTPPPTGK